MTADEILRKHEDANEHHFHDVDRKWIIEAMKEYAAGIMLALLERGATAGMTTKQVAVAVNEPTEPVCCSCGLKKPVNKHGMCNECDNLPF